MKNNNKLARNAIRARKAQKKRAKEQDKPKKGKRWFSRLFALIGCLLLVSALALPCFADTSTRPTEPPPDYVIPTPDYRSIFNQFYSIEYTDPLGYLMNGLYYNEDLMPFLYQFTLSAPNSSVLVDEPITFNDFNYSSNGVACVVDLRNGYYYYFTNGYWSTQYTTSGTNRIVRIKYFEWGEDTPVEVLNLTLTYDYNTLVVLSSNVESEAYGFSGTSSDFHIAAATSVTNNSVLSYCYGLGFFTVDVYANYEVFCNGVSAGTDVGFNSGKIQGEEHGYYDGWNFGYDEGVTDGYNSGSREGYEDGYDAGYEQGLQDGYNNDAFQAGYDQAVSEIDSGDWGKNFLANIFNAPMHAMNEFVIASWETPVGTMHVTLGLVVGSVIGLSLFILFLKLFAGG